jgi:hypothetical protein
VPVTAARIHPKPAGGERDAELGFLNHTNPTQQPAGGERDAELGFLNRAAVGGAEHD